MKLLRNVWRRWFGRYEIEDPRPIVSEAPYTFFLPSENELLALAPGDLTKIMIRSIPESLEWDAERMWVIITVTNGDMLEGTLDNEPCDIPQLKPGAKIRFRRSDVIDLQWADNREVTPPSQPDRRQFWDRCLVDNCVLEGRSRVDYLYRDEPDMTGPDDLYPDSGWRIRGEPDAINDDEANDRSPEYIALGKVLNVDDSWIPLIDASVGSYFQRDATGKFVPVAPPDDAND